MYIQESALKALSEPPSPRSRTYQIFLFTSASISISLHLHLAGLYGRCSVDAVLGWTLGDRLGLVAGGGTLELLADGLNVGSTTGQCCGATEVGVDASKDLSVVGLDVLHDDAAGDGVLAVAARAVELAEIDHG
jgi:hypothetical protein